MRVTKWLSSLVVSGAVAASDSAAQSPILPPDEGSVEFQILPTTKLTKPKDDGRLLPAGWLNRGLSPYAPNRPAIIPASFMQEPKKGEEPKKKDEPKKEELKQPDPAPNNLAGATEAGTQPGEQFNPYMFGDRFGGGFGTANTRVGSLVGFAFLSNNGATNTVVNVANVNGVFGIPITNSNIVAANGGNPNATFPVTLPGVATGGVVNTTATTAVTASQAQTILFPVPGTTFQGGGVPLQNNAAFQQFVDQVFKGQFGPNGRTVFTSASLSAGAGSTGVPSTTAAGAYQFNFAPDSQAYFAYDYIAAIALPLPSAGGVVGTTKISEGNSPMPRDRVIFDYDYFSNVPLTAGGIDVSRFSPGFEKTFFNGRTSFELRLPFASTVDPISSSDGLTNRSTVLGNLNMTLKALFYSSATFNFSTGMGVALPTAPDTRLTAADGSELVAIRNRTVLLTPYIAGLFTPNERFYAQAWGLVSFDASGSPVYVNPGAGALAGVGRIYDQTILQLDVQSGYWLIRDGSDSRFLNGLAPFLELHYNTPINDATTVGSGSFVIGSSTNRFDELNIAFGVNTVLRNRVNLVAGVVLPLNTGDSRFFDAQFGVRMNWVFGGGRGAFVPGF